MTHIFLKFHSFHNFQYYKSITWINNIQFLSNTFMYFFYLFVDTYENISTTIYWLIITAP